MNLTLVLHFTKSQNSNIFQKLLILLKFLEYDYSNNFLFEDFFQHALVYIVRDNLFQYLTYTIQKILGSKLILVYLEEHKIMNIMLLRCSLFEGNIQVILFALPFDNFVQKLYLFFKKFQIVIQFWIHINFVIYS